MDKLHLVWWVIRSGLGDLIASLTADPFNCLGYNGLQILKTVSTLLALNQAFSVS